MTLDLAEPSSGSRPTHCTGHDPRRKLEDTFGKDHERVGVGSTVEF